MGPRAKKIKSQPDARDGNNRSMMARSWRLARLRTTAVPTAFPAEIPIRSIPSALGNATNTTNGCGKDFPFRRTREKSVACLSRNARFTHIPVRLVVPPVMQMDQDRCAVYQRTFFLTWLFFDTVSRTRPRKRRRFSTSRPSAVAIRARKPWTRTRRRILG